MTALVTKKFGVTSNCPYSEGPLQSEYHDWLPMTLSLHQNCPYIECPYKESLVYREYKPSSSQQHASKQAALQQQATEVGLRAMYSGKGRSQSAGRQRPTGEQRLEQLARPKTAHWDKCEYVCSSLASSTRCCVSACPE